MLFSRLMIIEVLLFKSLNYVNALLGFYKKAISWEVRKYATDLIQLGFLMVIKLRELFLFLS